MRAFIKNYIEAEKARREEEGREAGFSLIELIVVVVILGILVAIAIPVFLSIQDQAEQNTVKTAAANGAAVAAAEIAKDGDSAGADFDSLETGGVDSVDVTAGNTDLETLCVTAIGLGWTATAGPGCGSTVVATAP